VGQPSVPIPNVPPNPVSPPPPAVQAPAANPSAQPNAVAMVPPPPVIQPPVPQPPPQPVVVKPTPAELDALRHRIGQWASGQSCTLLDGDVGESGAATFNGFAGHGTVDDLRTSLLSILPPSETNWQVAGVNRVFCAALTALHRIAPPFGSPGQRLGLLALAQQLVHVAVLVGVREPRGGQSRRDGERAQVAPGKGTEGRHELPRGMRREQARQGYILRPIVPGTSTTAARRTSIRPDPNSP